MFSLNKILRATIAVPSVCDFYFTPHRFSSLGAKILHKLLTENHVDTSIVFFPLLRKHNRILDIPSELSYLRKLLCPHETGKLSFFTNYRRFGPSPDECASIIVSTSPDICFISCFAFSYALQTLELARHLKKIKPLLPIAIGGAGPSAYPLYFIRDSSVDFVLTHEAETSMKAFLDTFRTPRQNYTDVPNCFWKKDNHPQQPSIHRLTQPEDISIIISKSCETRHSVYFSSSFSRGCPKKCAFCSNFLAHGSSFRVADIDKVKNALTSLPIESVKSSKSHFIIFEDDNLLLEETFCFEVMRLLKKTYHQATFLFENGIDYTLLSPTLVDRLVKEGASKFNLSIVSVNHGVARKESRSLDIDRYRQVVRSIATHRIPCITYFICGFKEDSKESVAETLAFLFSQPTLIGISLFYAVPGINDFRNLSQFDTLPPFLCNGSSAYPWNASLSTETMVTAFRLSRYCNLVKQPKKSALEIAALRRIQETKRLFTFVKTHDSIGIVPVEHYDEELTEMFFSRVLSNQKKSNFAP